MPVYNFDSYDTLQLTIKRGINLKGVDMGGTSDPFVVVKLEKVSELNETKVEESYKTQVIKKNCNPEWNETFTLKK